MAKATTTKTNLLILVSCVAVSAILALGWIIFRETIPNSTRNVYENNQSIVINNVGASSDLVSALLNEAQNCPVHKNVDYIDKQVGDFAVVRYGCGLDATTIYKKSSNSWSALNTTNQLVNSVPYCAFTKDNDVPVTIEPFCYDGTFKDGVTPNVISNPVK
jgi:hypothetical protein